MPRQSPPSKAAAELAASDQVIGQMPAVSVAAASVFRRSAARAGRIFLFLLVALLVAGAVFTYRISLSHEGWFGGSNGIVEQVKQLVLNEDKPLLGESDNRINILLIGYGGAGHSGAYLSDTIIVASIKPSAKQAALISLPRDLFVPISGNGWRKINNAFAFGQDKNDPAGGAKLLTATVEDILDIKIPYYVQIDFSGFEKMVDAIGGIDVTVRCGFVDEEYPTLDFGYQTVTFRSGEQHFNGAQALKFARSRHGVADSRSCDSEGSDFARSRRQQQILQAARAKLLSLGTLVRPQRIVNLLDEVGSHAGTNLQLWEMARIAQLARDLPPENVSSATIDSSNLLYSTTTIDGAYILRPNAGLDNFSELAALTRDIFPTSAAALPAKTKPTLVVLNGTTVAGLAGKTADTLRQKGYTIAAVANAPRRDFAASLIYDLTNGQKAETLIELETNLTADVAGTVPEDIASAGYQVDFVVVVGRD